MTGFSQTVLSWTAFSKTVVFQTLFARRGVDKLLPRGMPVPAMHSEYAGAEGSPFHAESFGGNDVFLAGKVRFRAAEAGVTLIELIIVVTMIAILASAAIPVARFQVKRTKERELRRDLWAMRTAIDAYKDAADKGGIQTKADSNNYPPDLQTLVTGVDIQTKKVRFLRSIPTDPMTGSTDWGLRSNQDDPTSDSFGGQNVFDVFTKNQGTALDGSKYSTW